MPTTYLTDFVTATRYLLKDSVATYDFSDTEVQAIITHVLKEISDKSPYKVKETALVTANSKLLDISGISNLLKVNRVEWEIGADPPNNRNFKYEDTETISMVVDSAPSTTGTSGTLAGTVTFTAGSATVTGSGTAFNTALAQDYYICKSTGTRWYRVYSVESATSLTLDEPVKTADTGADVVASTKYRYNVAVIHCEKLHTLTDAIKTLNQNEERVLTEGTVAYCLSMWVNKLRSQVNEAVTKISDLGSSTDKMTAMIQRAIDDLSSGRALIDENRADALTEIDNVDQFITQATANLALGRTYIDTVPIGAAPESDYITSCNASLNIASTHLRKANSLLSADNVSNAFANSARSELSAASMSINQAGGYARELTSRLNIASTIMSYQNKADRQMQIYKQALNEITPMKTVQSYSSG
jgi:hypothetical protein